MVVVFAWFAGFCLDWWLMVFTLFEFCLVMILMLGYVLLFICWLLNSVVCLLIRFIVIGACGLFGLNEVVSLIVICCLVVACVVFKCYLVVFVWFCLFWLWFVFVVLFVCLFVSLKRYSGLCGMMFTICLLLLGGLLF